MPIFIYQFIELRPILPTVTLLALLALWIAFPAMTPQHCYDTPPTNGKAPRARSLMACILINSTNLQYEFQKYEKKITDS